MQRTPFCRRVICLLMLCCLIVWGSSVQAATTSGSLVADENWAVTMAEHRKGTATTGFLLGGGLCLISVWCFGTLFGHTLGAIVKQPEVWALDFAFIAVFTALAVSLWRGRVDILPWAVAAILAVLAEKYLPGKWYIVIGGIGGALGPLVKGNSPDEHTG